MIARYLPNGTPVMDFAATEKIARGKSSEALRYAIKDCNAVIAAMPDNVKNGYYADEIHVYAAELQRRFVLSQPIPTAPTSVSSL